MLAWLAAMGLVLRDCERSALLGSWYDGGPYCAYLAPASHANALRAKFWYCNVGIEYAAEVLLVADGNVYRNAEHSVEVDELPEGRLRVNLSAPLRDRLSNEYGPGHFSQVFWRSEWHFGPPTEERIAAETWATFLLLISTEEWTLPVQVPRGCAVRLPSQANGTYRLETRSRASPWRASTGSESFAEFRVRSGEARHRGFLYEVRCAGR